MKPSSFTVILLFLSFIFISPAVASQQTTTDRSLFFSARIYLHNAAEGKIETLLEAAKTQMRQLALEKLSSYLKSSLPEGSTFRFSTDQDAPDTILFLKSDTFDASDIGPDITEVYFFGQSRFEITGTVVPPLIGTDIISDKDTYAIGDELHFSINSNQETNLCFIYISTDGEVTQLLPNTMSPQVVYPGRQHSFPDKEKYGFSAQEPTGVDQLVLFTSNIPIGEIVEPGEKYQYFAQTRSDRARISDMFRSRVIDHLKQKAASARFSIVQFIETSRNIEIVPR